MNKLQDYKAAAEEEALRSNRLFRDLEAANAQIAILEARNAELQSLLNGTTQIVLDEMRLRSTWSNHEL